MWSSSKEMADNYLKLNQLDKAESILTELAETSLQYASWYLSLDDMRFINSYEDCIRNIYCLDEICKSLKCIVDSETGKECETAQHYYQKFGELYKLLETRVGRNK